MKKYLMIERKVLLLTY